MRKSRSPMSPELTAIVTNGKKCAQGREKLKLNAGLAGAGMMYSLSEAVPTKASGSLLGENAKTERAPGEKKMPGDVCDEPFRAALNVDNAVGER